MVVTIPFSSCNEFPSGSERAGLPQWSGGACFACVHHSDSAYIHREPLRLEVARENTGSAKTPEDSVNLSERIELYNDMCIDGWYTSILSEA